jgi:cholesterol oxidase
VSGRAADAAGSRLSVTGMLGAAGGDPEYDCVVVGSGFGAAVLAARLAPHVRRGRLAVLERGLEIRPGEFPETLRDAVSQVRSTAMPLGIFDLRLARDLDALVANVLGGGSQLYAGVTIEPLPQTFDIRRDPADPGSPRAWPEPIDARTLRPYFDRVRGVLEVERWIDRDTVTSDAGRFDPELSGSWCWGCEDGVDHHRDEPLRDHTGRQVRHRPPLRRAAAFDRAANAAGESTSVLPLAINLTRYHGTVDGHGTGRPACTGCGNCITGCNVGAKNSLTVNYLPMAVDAGAEIHTGVEVRYLRPSERAGYRWALATLVRRPDGGTRRVVVHARTVVLGAGVFGTVGILFESRRRGLPVPGVLGSRLSGNGDAIMLAPRWASGLGRGQPPDVLDEPGPTITRMTDLRARPGRRHLVQDAVAPDALAGVLARAAAYGSADRDGARYAVGVAADALLMLAMGYDSATGRLVERDGRLDVRWPAAGRDPVQLAERRTGAAMAAAAGSPLVANPRLGGGNAGTPITVHPIGGAPMGSCAEDGVVDHVGRLLRPDGGVAVGCYVADASIIPTAVGANPSLTIAALAERAAEVLIAEDLPRLLDTADIREGVGAC